MSSKIGVYICTGYGIGEALNVDELAEVATGEFSVDMCKTVPSCDAEDLEFIRKDIADEGLEKVVIAGPSPRFYSSGSFPENVIVEIVNLILGLVFPGIRTILNFVTEIISLF